MKYVVAGIDTEVGKTFASTLLCHALGASYWKPIQAGMEEMGDREWLYREGGIPVENLIPEAYRFSLPASPHIAATHDGVQVDIQKLLKVPDVSPLIIEGAGGLMVPIASDFLFIDLFEAWNLPVILVAKSYLGSINHTLLSIEALQSRAIPVKGIIFNEGDQPEGESIIIEHSSLPCIGCIPDMLSFGPNKLKAAATRLLDVSLLR